MRHKTAITCIDHLQIIGAGYVGLTVQMAFSAALILKEALWVKTWRQVRHPRQLEQVGWERWLWL